jgi:hypothetical protein
MKFASTTACATTAATNSEYQLEKRINIINLLEEYRDKSCGYDNNNSKSKRRGNNSFANTPTTKNKQAARTL